MKKKLAIFFLFVLGGFILRVFHYWSFPVFGETADESAWTHLGASLIQEGVPASWSYFGPYQPDYVYKTGVYDAPIVRPVFDHPPLFSLLPGLTHALKGDWLELPSSKVIRLPLVLLGALNVGLFWLVAEKFFKDKGWAVFATLLFMTIPEIVFGSRLVVAENLIVTWNLLAMIALFYSEKKWSNRLLFVVSVLAVLTKVSGLVVPVVIISLGFIEKKWDWFRAGMFGLISGVIIYVLYGVLYNFDLFWAVLQSQAGRELGFATLQNRMFLHPTIVKNIFFDGWKIFGLLASFIVLLKKDTKYLVIQLFTVLNLVFIVLTVGEGTLHGWYDYVLWPSFVLAISIVFREIYVNGNNVMFGFAWMFLLPVVRLVAYLGNISLGLWAIRGIVSVGFMPLLFESISLKKSRDFSMKFLFLLLLMFNILVVYLITIEKYWLQSAWFESFKMSL